MVNGQCSALCGKSSVDLLNGWATSACSWWGTSRHTTRHASRHATLTACCLVNFHHDGVHDAFQLFLLGLKLILLCKLVLVKPIKCLLHGLLDLVLVITLKFVLELLLLECVAHGEAVVLKAILGLNLCLIRFVFRLELLCLGNHAINLGL